jgi:hypothetical protein
MEIKTVETRKQIEDILKEFILNHKTVEFEHDSNYFKLSVNQHKQQFEVDTTYYKAYFGSSWNLVDYILELCGF